MQWRKKNPSITKPVILTKHTKGTKNSWLALRHCNSGSQYANKKLHRQTCEHGHCTLSNIMPSSPVSVIRKSESSAQICSRRRCPEWCRAAKGHVLTLANGVKRTDIFKLSFKALQAPNTPQNVYFPSICPEIISFQSFQHMSAS